MPLRAKKSNFCETQQNKKGLPALFAYMSIKKAVIGLFAACCGCLLTAVAQQQPSQEQMALNYFQNKDYEKAASIFSALYQQKPDNYYYTYYFQCLLETGDYKEAERVVNRQIRRLPSMQRYPVDLGYVYEKEGNMGKAQKQYERCIGNYPHNEQSLKELANAFLACRQEGYAIRCYEKIRTLTGNPSDYAYELSLLHSRNGRYEAALQELMLWVQTNPDKLHHVETELLTWMADDEDRQKRTLIGKTLLHTSNKHPEDATYARLLLWYTLQEKDFSAALKQAAAIDKRFRGEGRMVYETSTIAGERQAYAVALEGYELIRKSYSEYSPCYDAAVAGSLHIRYLQLCESYPPSLQDIRKLKTELDTFFNRHALQDALLETFLNRIEIEALYLKNTESAKMLLEEALSRSRLSASGKAVCKLRLGDIYHSEDEVWEATLLYSQVEKAFPNDTIGQNAKFKNAKLAFYMGEFEWAKAQLDVLRAATSKLIANDAMHLSMLIEDNRSGDSLNRALHAYAKADYFYSCKEYAKAKQALDSIALYDEESLLEDDALFLRARIALGERQYAEADRTLESYMQRYPDEICSDDALFLRACIQEEHLHDPLTAMDLYQQLLKAYPDSLHAAEARKRFRALRSSGNPLP